MQFGDISIKSMTKFASVDGILMEANFELLFFKKHRRACYYTAMLNVTSVAYNIRMLAHFGPKKSCNEN